MKRKSAAISQQTAVRTAGAKGAFLETGYNINATLLIYPSPLVGMQGWYDNICTVVRA